MSFVEKNKAWLLPLLGLGVAGVVWLNIRTFNKPAGSASSPAPAEGALPASAPQAPAPIPPPSVPTPAKPPASGAADLWADLRSLETPSAQLMDSGELMKRGREPLRLTESSRALPRLHPELWKGLHSPNPVKPQESARSAPAQAGALPPLDFVMQLPGKRVAFMGGRPFMEGQTPDGAHRIQRIHERSVVLSGPQGSVVLSTDLRPAKPAAPVPPEAK